jgi:hypothetical protein
VIEPLGDGRFRAAGAGTTHVVAYAAATESSIELRVDSVRAVSLTVIEPPSTIQVDDVVELEAEIRDQRGRPVGQGVTWRTSDPWIARINVRGVLEGAGPGSATITAECGGLSDSFEIEVTAAPWATVVFQSGSGKTTEEPEGPADELAAEEPEPATADVHAAAEAGSARARDHAPAPLDAVRVATVAATEHSRRPARPRGIVFIATVAVAGVAAIVWFALPGGNDSPPVEPLPLAELAAASVSIIDADGNAVPGALQLTEGDTVQFGVLVATADGTALTDVPVRWSTTDASLASIDASGNLIALRHGRVGVAAVAGDATGDIDLTIAGVAPPVAIADDPPTTRQPQQTQTETPGTGEVEQSPPPVTEAAPPPEPPPGTFRMRVEPWANVTVNDEAHANWTQDELSLAPGRYDLRLEHPAMMTVDTTFEIRSGEITTFAIILRPRGS